MHSPSANTDATAVLDSLRRLVRALRVSSHGIEQDLGITGAQLFVLREIAAEPNCSIRRLSERTLTDPSSVSVVVARLVKQGAIARHRDRTDTRRSQLSLTASGKQLLARAGKPFQARLIVALCSLPRRHLRRLSVDLTALVAKVGAGKGIAPMFFDEPRRKARRGR